jgi:hypothetical protein
VIGFGPAFVVVPALVIGLVPARFSPILVLGPALAPVPAFATA